MAPPSNSRFFPSYKCFARIPPPVKSDKKHTELFDVKFYPYTEPGVDPVFAAVGGAETIVCRASTSDSSGIEIIAWFHDETIEEDEDASLNSCCWSQDLSNGDPLLCVAGSGSIRVFNVREKKLIRTLIGHGKDINDLAVSPLSPDIIASASMDFSVRFWSLDPKYEKQPTVLICGGEGHKDGLLTMAFHQSGRYLLTGGMDCFICLWVIPDLPNEASGSDKPTILHAPHFASNAVHANFVDCIQWHHDLILSKCAGEATQAVESKIVLWRIEGFSSSQPPPPRAPTTHEYRATRSAYGGTYQRLLEFDATGCTPFYMRFGVFGGASGGLMGNVAEGGGGIGDSGPPYTHPVLAVVNERSNVSFWDLQLLEQWDGTASYITDETEREGPAQGHSTRGGGRGRGKGRGTGRGGYAQALLRESHDRTREGSTGSSTTSHTRGSVQPANAGSTSTSTPQPGHAITNSNDASRPLSLAHRRYSTADPFRPLQPHKQLDLRTKKLGYFCGRQVAWSTGGEYMAFVGSQGVIGLFARDKPDGASLSKARETETPDVEMRDGDEGEDESEPGDGKDDARDGASETDHYLSLLWRSPLTEAERQLLDSQTKLHYGWFREGFEPRFKSHWDEDYDRAWSALSGAIEAVGKPSGKDGMKNLRNRLEVLLEGVYLGRATLDRAISWVIFSVAIMVTRGTSLPFTRSKLCHLLKEDAVKEREKDLHEELESEEEEEDEEEPRELTDERLTKMQERLDGIFPPHYLSREAVEKTVAAVLKNDQAYQIKAAMARQVIRRELGLPRNNEEMRRFHRRMGEELNGSALGGQKDLFIRAAMIELALLG